MHVVLETERLILRRFTTDDVDNLVELDGDPDVMLYITGGRVTPREEIETDYLPAFLGYYERGRGYGFWAVVEKSTGDFLGWFHFRPGEGHPDDEPQLGYRFRKVAWGKGYAAEGSIALIDRGFIELDVRRVVAWTMVVNTASRTGDGKGRDAGSCGRSTRSGRTTSPARTRATSSTRSPVTSGATAARCRTALILRLANRRGISMVSRYTTSWSATASPVAGSVRVTGWRSSNTNRRSLSTVGNVDLPAATRRNADALWCQRRHHDAGVVDHIAPPQVGVVDVGVGLLHPDLHQVFGGSEVHAAQDAPGRGGTLSLHPAARPSRTGSGWTSSESARPSTAIGW